MKYADRAPWDEALAEMLSAPVIAFRTGQGVLPADHPLSVGLPVGHDLWRTCDAVLALGTRLQTQQMQWGVDDAMKIIHIDIDADEPGRINPPAVGLQADLADALPLLVSALDGKEADRPDWMETVREAKARFAAVYADKLAPQMGKDQILVMNLCGRGDKDVFTVGKILGYDL